MAQAQHANGNKITWAQQALKQSYSSKWNLILQTKQQIGMITVYARSLELQEWLELTTLYH